MNFMEHPENTDGNEWSIKSLEESLKLRQIWQDSLRHESKKIRGLLQHAWYPYFALIQHKLKDLEPGFELESCIYIHDKFKLLPPSKMATERYMTTIAQLTFHWVPILSEDDEIDENFKIIVAEFDKKTETFIKKVATKFAAEVNMDIEILYE
jgi:NAD-dependent DNA ligase